MPNKIDQMKAKMKSNALEGAKSRMKKDLLSDSLLIQLDTDSLREIHNFWMKKTHLDADTLEELDFLESNRKSIRTILKLRGEPVGQPGYRFPLLRGS
jgi:hypothetical protein